MADDDGVEVGSLVGAGRYEEASIRATLDNQVFIVCVFLLLEILRRRNKIIKTVLFLFFDACSMPVLAEFTTATDAGQGIDSLHVIKENLS